MLACRAFQEMQETDADGKAGPSSWSIEAVVLKKIELFQMLGG